jgi:uncharacterized protein (TIGR02145 family)
VSAWKTFAIQSFSRPVLGATGPADTVRLVEDSSSTVSFTVQNFVGSSLSIKFAPVDTSLIPAQSWKLVPDAAGKVSISLQGKPDAFGGPLTTIATLSDSVDAVNLIVPITIAARNDAPKFRIRDSKTVLISSASTLSLTGWIDSVTAGPANEASQKVSFDIQVPSAQTSQFSVLPRVDSAGTLRFAGKANSSGTVQIQVRAHDNGDSAGTNVNVSGWISASLIFDVPPTITLSNRSVSTWEGHAATDSATLWGNAGVANLVVGWTVSDTTLLPHDNLVFPGSGDLRVFQMRPVAGKWGSTKIVFTVTDSLGATAKDTLTLTVNPVNHAPILTLKSPALLDTTWRGEQTFALATLSWDDAATQTGRVDLQLANPLDSSYLSILRVDGAGMLHVSAKLDTSVSIAFRIRAHDSAGTANGGVDTSAWSNPLTLRLVDTVKDAQGNGYRARRMPDGKVWMRSNLRRTPMGVDSGNCAQSDCLNYGVLYTWSQAMNLPLADDSLSVTMDRRPTGLCPQGWVVPDTMDWSGLNSASGVNHLKSISGWLYKASCSVGPQGLSCATDQIGNGDDTYGFTILPALPKKGFTDQYSIQSKAGYWTSAQSDSISAIFWGYDNTETSGRGVFPKSWTGLGDPYEVRYKSVRCRLVNSN